MFLKVFKFLPFILNLLGVILVVLSLFVVKDPCNATWIWMTAFISFLAANVVDMILGTPIRILPYWALIILDLSILLMILSKLLDQCFSLSL